MSTCTLLFSSSIYRFFRGSVLSHTAPSPSTNSAIVNAANQGCLGGGAVDGAITYAGGKELAELRRELPTLGKADDLGLHEEAYEDNDKECRCPTGYAVITGPATSAATGGETFPVFGRLHVNHIIHAVGPRYYNVSSHAVGDELLRSAYRNSMQRAKEHGLVSVGFSLLSAGVFRGERGLSSVISIGVEEVVKFGLWEGLEDVAFYSFTEEEAGFLEGAGRKWCGE